MERNGTNQTIDNELLVKNNINDINWKQAAVTQLT